MCYATTPALKQILKIKDLPVYLKSRKRGKGLLFIPQMHATDGPKSRSQELQLGFPPGGQELKCMGQSAAFLTH